MHNWVSIGSLTWFVLFMKKRPCLCFSAVYSTLLIEWTKLPSISRWNHETLSFSVFSSRTLTKPESKILFLFPPARDTFLGNSPRFLALSLSRSCDLEHRKQWIWLKAWERARPPRAPSQAVTATTMWGPTCTIAWWKPVTNKPCRIPSSVNSLKLTSIACLQGSSSILIAAAALSVLSISFSLFPFMKYFLDYCIWMHLYSYMPWLSIRWLRFWVRIIFGITVSIMRSKEIKSLNKVWNMDIYIYIWLCMWCTC